MPGPPLSTSSPAPPRSEVVAGAAVEREQDRRGREASRLERVSAAEAVDDQPVAPASA